MCAWWAPAAAHHAHITLERMDIKIVEFETAHKLYYVYQARGNILSIDKIDTSI
ncbi:hypothetical protein KDK_81260 [Dictyobacter kobayashii]|uniref:Uncharacterized protein n=1 Tax=Dictyobacter kobayashii TaxID=2014872 RepID=A0A402AYZ0_9CHLR|nr:hypothetical protein KDK_81260 [Dictyobacter kobayashii]